MDTKEVEIQITKDGSSTLFIPSMDETYHSTHGAIQEAKHVFIENGIQRILKKEIKVLEVGLGTGLNAILTYAFGKRSEKQIHYVGLETRPLESSIITELNYSKQSKEVEQEVLNEIHQCAWNEWVKLSESFTLKKIETKVQAYTGAEQFDVIYYDAFGPRAQSEMWLISIFELLYDQLVEDGLLVTYCAMGQFKRDLKACGFEVISLPGPPGKREMTLAIKKQ